MRLERQGNGWWVCDCGEGIEDHGPFDSRAEAAEAKRQIERFLKQEANDAE